MTIKRFHLFLLAIGDVAGVDDGIVHLVAVEAGGIKVATRGASQGTGGNRACPAAADILIAATGFGVTGGQPESANSKYQKNYFFHYHKVFKLFFTNKGWDIGTHLNLIYKDPSLLAGTDMPVGQLAIVCGLDAQETG